MSVTRQLHFNKQQIVDCSQDRTIIEGRLFCSKCKAETNRTTKKFNNCRSLFYHLISMHSGTDKTEQPTLDEAIWRLQNISNEIQLGGLK